MDINDFMKKNLELLERIAEGIESLNDQGIAVTNIALPVGTELLAVGDVIKAGPADKATTCAPLGLARSRGVATLCTVPPCPCLPPH